MVIGAGCFVFMFAQQIVCWIFLVGALLFAAMQVNQAYEGHNPTIKRLKKIMTFADTITYFNVVYNKWVLLLLAAAILEMYSMHRIASELKKDAVEDEADSEEQGDAPATDRQ